MSEKKASLEQLRHLWQQFSIQARIGIIATTVICTALIIGVSYWSAQPNYIPLVSKLEPGQAGEIISQLNSAGIANQMNFSGSTVLVDSRKWNSANQLIAEIVEPGQMEPGPMQSWGSDPSTRDNRLARQLEARLAASISRLKSVESARVHLGIPESQPFARNQVPKTASVILEISPGHSFTSNQAQTIVSIVSNGVDGLRPENVNVSDTTGKLLTGDSEFGGVVANQIEIRRNIEMRREKKAENMLESMLGPGRAIVRVTADIDFTKVTRRQDRVDPTSKVPTSEISVSTIQTQPRQTAMGPPGTSSNLGGGRGRRSSSDVVSKSETTNLKFESSKTSEETTHSPGTIKRLTVAAVVQLTGPNSDSVDAPAASSPETNATESGSASVTKEDIERLIKEAVGFDEKRKDKIELVISPLSGKQQIAALLEPEESVWISIGPILKNVALGVGALIALMIGLLTLNRIRPVSINVPSDANVSPQRARQISDMVSLARKHPDLLSNVMAAWLNEGRNESDDVPDEKTIQRAA